MKIKDIEAWLRDDSDVEKVAEDNSNSGSQSEDYELMDKLASEFEDEQFQKLASDAWTMGEIMGHSFLNTLEKVAIEDVDGRIAGDINESVRGEPPMMAQKAEDERPTQLVPGKNVAAPMVDSMLHRKVTKGAVTEGEDASAQEGHQLTPPPSPENVEQDPDGKMKKKVASFIQGKLHSDDGLDKEAARDILKQMLRGEL